ncbi:unnamed protein product [Fraxinus pennsylvanica]|uniref:Uncharacterized protein n=1 Tax=Fraxinus pennsylvanica TaxID=56036 RepID=A0AAD2E5F5_9LAMI|nr:unnamed protein product [Fraxinus pennsylvanica]
MSPHGPSDYRITSYIWLMDSLIDNANDVKELRKKRILVNNLGSDEHLAQLFNEIAIDLVPDLYVYADTMQQIEDHCQNKGLVWMAEWLHDHFSSPWTILAFLGAIFALFLTVVQTYFAIFPRYPQKPRLPKSTISYKLFSCKSRMLVGMVDPFVGLLNPVSESSDELKEAGSDSDPGMG